LDLSAKIIVSIGGARKNGEAQYSDGEEIPLG
jgi:hypothetical protein